jgi:pilus assembly protein CpaB
VLLAVVGALMLLSYVAGADQRALAGVKTVTVLVVAKPIAAGTSADQLTSLVKPKKLPALAVTSGAVGSLSQVTGKVTTADLVPGEQLLAQRFVDPATLAQANEVKVPAGMQQLSVALDPQRVVAGQVQPGSRVGVFVSLPKDGDRPAQTHQLLHKVLVTKLQGGGDTTSTAGKAVASAATAASAGGVLVTLALNGGEAERVVYGAEYGTIWLSVEPSDASQTNTQVVTEENVDQ